MKDAGFCDRCGLGLSPAAALCPACGATRGALTGSSEGPYAFCDACGDALAEDAVFCSGCGAARNAPAGSPPSPTRADTVRPEPAPESDALGSAPTGDVRVPTRRSTGGRWVKWLVLAALVIAAKVIYKEYQHQKAAAEFVRRLPKTLQPPSPHVAPGSRTPTVRRPPGGPVSPSDLSNEDRVFLTSLARAVSVTIHGFAAASGDGKAGTGFVLERREPYALVATNRHVVMQGDREEQALSGFRITESGGQSHDALLLFVESDWRMDFALLAVRDPAGRLQPVVDVSAEAVVGEYVVCGGNPLQSGLAAFEGRVTEVSRRQGMVVTDCVSQSGSSGGPIIGGGGRVLGITAMLSRPGVAGHERTVGFLLGDYLQRLRSHLVLVSATRGWQESGVVVPVGANLHFLAQGTWSCGPFCGRASAFGVAGYSDQSLDRRHPHAALLAQVGADELPKCVCMVRQGGSERSGAVAAFGSAGGGPLRLRPNDTDLGNNEGYLEVLVVVQETL